MSNEIKVKVDYEKPESKLDALMAEYYAAQNAFKSTKEELMPLINAGGKAKFDAIMDQMETVIEYMRQECLITGYSPKQHTVFYDNGTYDRFTIKYWNSDGEVRMWFNGSSCNEMRLKFEWNPTEKEQQKELIEFLSHNYSEKIINDLIQCCTAQIRLKTKQFIDKTDKLHKTLDGIRGGK